jgi:hypothetical protein
VFLQIDVLEFLFDSWSKNAYSLCCDDMSLLILMEMRNALDDHII